MTLDLRSLTPDYAVAPQIEPEDLAAIKAAGFVLVIDNRPDGEIGGDLWADSMAIAAEAAGLRFVVNPVYPGEFTPDLVARQREAVETAGGPVLAYCASGNRSSIVWALSQAGKASADDLISAGARWGYMLEGLRPQIEALAARNA